MKKQIFIWIALVLMMLTLCGCASENDEVVANGGDEAVTAAEIDASALDEIVAPISNRDCEGKDYASIEKLFIDAGFTNVTLYPSAMNIEESMRTDGEVITVWAGDKVSFEEGENLDRDTKIGIEYVMLNASDENENTKDETKAPATSQALEKNDEAMTTAVATEPEKDETKVAYTYKELSATKYAKSAVNVRALPDTSGDKVGALAKGDAVTVTGQCNETGWYRFDYNGETAYASNSYLVDELPPVEQQTSIPSTTETSTATNTATNTATPSTDTTSADSTKTNSVTVPDVAQQGDNMVWIPTNGGTKYHSKKSCSKMKDPMQVTKEQAEANGFTPCGRCY